MAGEVSCGAYAWHARGLLVAEAWRARGVRIACAWLDHMNVAGAGQVRGVRVARYICVAYPCIRKARARRASTCLSGMLPAPVGCHPTQVKA